MNTAERSSRSSFTVASELATGNLIVVACSPSGRYLPWPKGFTTAAYEVGRDCRCRACHNCEIFELLADYQIKIWDLNR
jgi:hypothetical protein